MVVVRRVRERIPNTSLDTLVHGYGLFVSGTKYNKYH